MRGYDPSDGACDGDASLIECRSCGAVYDVEEVEHECPDEGAPRRPLEDVPTERVRTPTDAELVDELEQHADCGQGGDL